MSTAASLPGDELLHRWEKEEYLANAQLEDLNKHLSDKIVELHQVSGAQVAETTLIFIRDEIDAELLSRDEPDSICACQTCILAHKYYHGDSNV